MRSSDDNRAKKLETGSKMTILQIFVLENNKKYTSELLDSAKKNLSPTKFSTFINSQDSRGQTALHYAALNSNLKVVEILLKHGANPLIKNSIGAMPLGIYTADYKVTKFINNSTTEHLITESARQMNQKALDEYVKKTLSSQKEIFKQMKKEVELEMTTRDDPRQHHNNNSEGFEKFHDTQDDFTEQESFSQSSSTISSNSSALSPPIFADAQEIRDKRANFLAVTLNKSKNNISESYGYKKNCMSFINNLKDRCIEIASTIFKPVKSNDNEASNYITR